MNETIRRATLMIHKFTPPYTRVIIYTTNYILEWSRNGRNYEKQWNAYHKEVVIRKMPMAFMNAI